jgi:hypothetical protein
MSTAPPTPLVLPVGSTILANAFQPSKFDGGLPVNNGTKIIRPSLAGTFYNPVNREGAKSALLTGKDASSRMNYSIKPGQPLAEMLLPITGNVTTKNNHFSRNSVDSPFKSRFEPTTCTAALNKTGTFFGRNGDSLR